MNTAGNDAAAFDVLLAKGVERQRAGDLDGAERIYRGVLAEKADHPDALNLLGVLAGQRGDLAGAAKILAEAIRIAPDAPRFHVNLGHILAAAGRPEDATECYRRAATISPEEAEFRTLLARMLHRRGCFHEAVEQFREAARLSPASPEAYADLGNALLSAGRLEEAEGYHRLALEFSPDNPVARYNLATAQLRLGKADAAESGFRMALAARPEYVEALSNLGICLRAQGRLEEAAEALTRAGSLDPRAAAVHHNLGIVLHEMDRLEEAEESLGRAVELSPGYAEALVNLGLTRKMQGRPDEAEACYVAARRADPDNVEAEWNLALVLLQRGDYARGFEMYEARWRIPDATTPWRDFGRPLWSGEPLSGRRILVHAEQGIGDAIQFARYVPLVAARGGRVVLEAASGTADLLGTVDGAEAVVTRGDPLPPFHVHCPLMSLPRIFGTTPGTVPATIPYLFADPAKVETWAGRLGSAGGKVRVGLRWAGRKAFKGDAKRSTSLSALSPLAGCRNAEFVSLQKDDGVGDLSSPPEGMAIRDFRDELGDLAETAALIANLDLVITTCTSIAHLSGALGRPTWILLQFVPDWRWMLGRNDSPWYPTVRLFRQPRRGDWASVASQVAGELERMRTG